LPGLVVAGSLTLLLLGLLIWHGVVVFDEGTGCDRRIELRYVLGRVEPRLLLQVAVDRVLVLTVPPVVALPILARHGAARVYPLDLLVSLGQGVHSELRRRVSARLLFHFRRALRMRQHLRQRVPLRGWRNARDILHLPNYEGS